MPTRSQAKKHKDSSAQASGDSAAEGSSGPVATGAKHWQSVRPWRPPEGLQDGSDASESSKLQVEVIDVASTAVALAFFAFDSSAHTPSTGEDSAHETNPSDAVSSQAQSQQQQQSGSATSSLTVKLNSNPWPHVLHSDPAFFQDLDPASDNNASQLQQQGATTLVIYGLDPGTAYQIELEWVAQHEAEGLAAAEDELPHSSLSTRPIMISTQSSSGTSSPSPNHDSFYGPPPPYSSHDPSTPDASQPATSSPASPPASLVQLRNTEAELRANLAALRERVKLTESNLNAPLASLKRSFEKSAKEDQRARQRISTLEEATRKLRLLAVEEAELADTLISEEVDPLQAEAAELSAKLEERRAQVHKIEVDAKKAMRADEDAITQLEQELEESDHRVEGLTSERGRFEQEVMPDLTQRLESLADELRLMEQSELHQEQYQQQQMAAAAAAAPWYSFAQHSNSSTSLHAFPANPVAVFPSAAAQGAPITQWPSMNFQRAPLRSAPPDVAANTTAAAPDWPNAVPTNTRSKLMPRHDSLEARVQSDNQKIVPGLLPRLSSDPIQHTTTLSHTSSRQSLEAAAPRTSENAEAAPTLAPATSSAGSRFLQGFRKRSFSTQQQRAAGGGALSASQSSSSSSPHRGEKSTSAHGSHSEEGSKKSHSSGKEESGMLSGLGSKLTRPGSSDSQNSSSGHTAKMSWSRVVGGKSRSGGGSAG